MLVVVLKDGSIREYNGYQFTDYDWKPEAFIVLNMTDETDDNTGDPDTGEPEEEDEDDLE